MELELKTLVPKDPNSSFRGIRRRDDDVAEYWIGLDK
jgi:hypothetical protein